MRQTLWWVGHRGDCLQCTFLFCRCGCDCSTCSGGKPCMTTVASSHAVRIWQRANLVAQPPDTRTELQLTGVVCGRHTARWIGPLALCFAGKASNLNPWVERQRSGASAAAQPKRQCRRTAPRIGVRSLGIARGAGRLDWQAV